MNCEYFGACASCTLHEKSYEEQLDFKLQREKERFSNFTDLEFGKTMMKMIIQLSHML